MEAGERESYDAVREMNDERHSDKRWSFEEKGRKWRTTPGVYISRHGVSGARRLADKTGPC